MVGETSFPWQELQLTAVQETFGFSAFDVSHSV